MTSGSAHVQTYETSIAVAASSDRVWAVWSAVARWPEWTASVTSAEFLNGATELRLGVRVRVRQPRLQTAVWTVTELVEGHHFTWTSSAPGLRTVATHEVAPDGAGAHVTVRIEQSGWPSRLVRVLIGGLVKRYLRLEAVGLKARSES